MDTRKNSGDIICRTPSVLEDIKAQLPRSIHVRVEHLADELHQRRLIRILLLELHDESEGAVFEWGVRGSDDDRVPGLELAPAPQASPRPASPQDATRHTIASHYLLRAMRIHRLEDLFACAGDELAWWPRELDLAATHLEVSHQATTSCCRHDGAPFDLSLLSENGVKWR